MARTLREKTSESSPQATIGKILLLVLVLVCLAAVWLTRMAHNYVYMFLDHYEGTTAILNDMKGLQRSESDLEALLPLQQSFDDWKQTHLRDDVSVVASDETILRGGLYDAGSDVTVVLLHPFDGSSESTDYLSAPYYAEKGYNILLPDSRDHGESGGNHVTYGLLEGGDTATWVRWLVQRYGPEHRVILHGCDLGANAALAGAALLQQDPVLKNTVCFAVAENPIANLYDTASSLLKNQFGIPGIVVRTADRYAGKSLGGRSMKDVSLADMTEASTVPALVICEADDTVIEPAPAERFCDGYAGACTLLELPGRHGTGYALDPEGYEAALDTMIAAYASRQP